MSYLVAITYKGTFTPRRIGEAKQFDTEMVSLGVAATLTSYQNFNLFATLSPLSANAAKH